MKTNHGTMRIDAEDFLAIIGKASDIKRHAPELQESGSFENREEIERLADAIIATVIDAARPSYIQRLELREEK
tara:strand:+ start:456 stop:677 length:222 start_codon:yes stop_codon:yes gene_type:complete